MLIDSNMNVEVLFSGSKEDKKAIKLSKGDYRLKIVGKNAKGQLQLYINKDSNIEISKQEES
ncbi:hypothetical protein IAI10_13315 [Clostridium sp. 19966]|uniref:hypothetical protein n=1 Tax=Clostridium sp. 19966 TaxID=2768166 RepID=UPI0028E07F3B|nr:hypothetical protein [Clostridium sp. 19966]MDT8717645.1 hypothetical protein [Clostridium sp. 19966]